jgi:hypothetical protein
MPARLTLGKDYYAYLQQNPCGVLDSGGNVCATGSAGQEAACFLTAASGVGGASPHGAIGAIVSQMKSVGVSFTPRAAWFVEDKGSHLEVVVLQTDATNYSSTMRTDGLGTRGKNFCEVFPGKGGSQQGAAR